MVVTVVGHLWKQLVELDGKDPDPVHQEIKKEPVTESVAVNNRWTLRRVLRQNTVNMHKKIHVFCRVRPTLDTEAGKGILHFNFPEDGNRVLEMDNLSVSGVRKSISEKQKSRKKYSFAFDKVFPPSTDQCHIFAQILPYIEFVFEGSSACIFACGHVGTGKTYTMGGDGTTHSNSVGLIPRAIKKIFEWEMKMTDYGWKFEFEFSYLEIYNEIIRDLLGNSDNLKIINRPRKQNIEVSNLKIFPIKSWLQARHLLHKAHRNRSVGKACFNGRRSLGHGIVQINIKAIHTDGDIRIGCLKLVDLAGNECVMKSGSEGKQLLEVKFINRSISNLVTVFTAIANKHRHIPYRNSKLTYLLRNSLRGSDKVLMFMNILPDADNFYETLNCLRFAELARHLLHKAHSNRTVGEARFNGRRSRGHGIVQINMKATHKDGETRIGCLKLVDLAGSECVKKSGSEGKQLLEVKFINRSISNLVTVFTAIANKHRHIPYRNSKLTYLLRNSLRGSDKVLMFMNILPDADNFYETLNCLRFAELV